MRQVERRRHVFLVNTLQSSSYVPHAGVVGLELTCNETVLGPEIAGEGGSVESLLFSAADIALLTAARERGVRRSVQAGEFGPPDMVFQAIEKLGADRIVFGYSVLQVGFIGGKLS